MQNGRIQSTLKKDTLQDIIKKNKDKIPFSIRWNINNNNNNNDGNNKNNTIIINIFSFVVVSVIIVAFSIKCSIKCISPNEYLTQSHFSKQTNNIPNTYIIAVSWVG